LDTWFRLGMHIFNLQFKASVRTATHQEAFVEKICTDLLTDNLQDM